MKIQVFIFSIFLSSFCYAQATNKSTELPLQKSLDLNTQLEAAIAKDSASMITKYGGSVSNELINITDPALLLRKQNEETLQKIIALQEKQIAQLKARIADLEKKNGNNTAK